MLSNIDLRGRNSSTWFTGYGENFGRTDQYLYLGGGMYDVFKAGAYLNDIPHTFSSNAYSPYNGNGGNLLTATFPLAPLPAPQPPGNWSNFTLGTERRDTGGFFEWQKNSPWYVRADGSQVSFSGTKVGAAANGTSPGNGYVDLAFPNDLRTSNFGVEGGYQTSKMTFAARWDYSKFDNANETLDWTNPYFGGNQLDTTYLAPDNTFNKFTLTGNYRDLPWKSVVSARYTWSKTTSDATLGQTALNTGPAYNATLPEQNTFNGENVNQSFALAWTATPMANRRLARLLLLDQARQQVRHHRLRQRADAAAGERAGLRQRPGPHAEHLGAGQLRERELQLHQEQRRLRRSGGSSRAATGWAAAGTTTTSTRRASTTTRRTRTSSGSSTRTRCSTRCPPGSSTSTSSATRTLNFTTNGLTANDPNYLLAFTSAFDLQSATTNQVKLNLDWNPLPSLGLAVRRRLVEPGLRRRDPRPDQVRPPGLLPVRQLGAPPTSWR